MINGLQGLGLYRNTKSFRQLEPIAYTLTPPIVTDSLLLYLDAGNPESYPGTGNTWFDLSGNNRHCTLINGVGYSSNNKGYLTTNGSNSYIVTPQIPLTGNSTASCTWCIWVRPSSNAGNIMSMSQSNPQGGWNMPPIAATSSTFRGRIWSNNYLYSTSYSLNSWYYVVLVWRASPSGQFLYVNNVLQSSQTGISYSASGANNYMFLGQSNPGADNTGMFAGGYGSFQIYGGKALTQEEIEQNFNALRVRYNL